MDDLDLGATIRGFSPGQKAFNRYTLRKILGRGGMGVVWLARDEELEIDVALKFLPEIVALDKESVSELKRETRRNLGLTHPHIVRVYDFVQGPTTAAISMEYVDGASLSALKLEQSGNVFAVEQLRPWLRQLCAALDYAHHSVQIVHRDLKPANLMVNARGELKITDFGIARSVADSVSRVSAQAGGSSGTPVYMSPQQMMGEDPALTDDLYAAGATLFELLTGKPPFHSGNILMQVQNKEAPLVNARRAAQGVTAPPVPDAWEQTIAACLAKNPADRPQSATEMAERLGLSSSPNAGLQTGGLATKNTKSTQVGAVAPNGPGVERLDPKTLVSSQGNALGATRSAKAPLYAGLAAVVVALAVAAWHFGVRLPAQERVRAEAARVVEQQRIEGLARVAEEKRLAEQERLATERRQVEQHNRTVEQEEHGRIMAMIAALPAGAGETQKAEVRQRVESFERTASARFQGQVQARWAEWEKTETARLAAEAAAKQATVPRFNVEPAASASKPPELSKAQAEQRREAARLAAVRAGRAQLVLDGTQRSVFEVPFVLFAADSLKIYQDYIGLGMTGVKLATVDLAKAYDSDPEVERATEDFRAAQAAAQQQAEAIRVAGQKLVDEYKELSEKSNNSALTSSTRLRAWAEAEKEKKLKQIELKQAELQNFIQNTEASLQAQMKTSRERILVRLVPQLTAQLKANGANLVLDISGPSNLRVPPVVYSDPGYDGGGGPAVKLLTIDLAKVYADHWKIQEFTAKMKAAEQQIQQEIEKLNQEGNKLVEEYKQLTDQSKNTALTAGARSTAEATSQRKHEEILKKQDELQTFKTNTERSQKQRQTTFRDLILEEITTMVRDIARRKGATLVMDVSGSGIGDAGLPLVISAEPSLDLTAEVQQEINKERP